MLCVCLQDYNYELSGRVKSPLVVLVCCEGTTHAVCLLCASPCLQDYNYELSGRVKSPLAFLGVL
jgi:hypothetical protein